MEVVRSDNTIHIWMEDEKGEIISQTAVHVDDVDELIDKLMAVSE